ncbi:unnamed protein product, partial [Allacma fusca]
MLTLNSARYDLWFFELLSWLNLIPITVDPNHGTIKIQTSKVRLAFWKMAVLLSICRVILSAVMMASLLILHPHRLHFSDYPIHFVIIVGGAVVAYDLHVVFVRSPDVLVYFFNLLFTQKMKRVAVDFVDLFCILLPFEILLIVVVYMVSVALNPYASYVSFSWLRKDWQTLYVFLLLSVIETYLLAQCFSSIALQLFVTIQTVQRFYYRVYDCAKEIRR